MMLIQGKDLSRATKAKVGHAACDLKAAQWHATF